MRSRPEPLFKQQLWQAGISPMAGVDEVGVGAWAGPVIAAAVVPPQELSLQGLNDSKLFSAKRLLSNLPELRARNAGSARFIPGNARRSPQSAAGVLWSPGLCAARRSAGRAAISPAAAERAGASGSRTAALLCRPGRQIWRG
ncbi:MAG: hypothetical protein JO189_14325 [Deltaproteobacteria bacterium]|nr:hypothetical protein [Deltaproteobacteria bacterium]